MLTPLLICLSALTSFVSAQTSSFQPNITLSSTGLNNITLSSTGLIGNISSSSTIPSFNTSSTGIIGNLTSSTGIIGSSSSTGLIGNITSSTGVIGNITSSSSGNVVIPPSSSTGSQGPTPFCGGAGYDMTSLANMDLTLDDGDYVWAIRPCGRVSPDLNLCDGMMCQDGTVVSRYEPTITNWYAIANGVNLEVQNGDAGGCPGPRESDINFICNSTQLTPRLVSISEPSTCHYRAIVHTAAACTRNTTYQPGVGDAFLSNICGGGAYDLSTINIDITAQIGNWNWTIRPCGLVSEPRCASAQPVSICQHAGNVWKLADYTHDVPLYEINPNGLNMSMESGTPCGNANRTTLVTFECDPVATLPLLVEASEYYICEYWFRVRTNAVCGAPFQVRSSSSGAPVVRSSSSSTGLVIGGSSSSSTGSPVIRSSSSSTGAAGQQSSSSVIPPIFGSSSSSSGTGVPPIFDSSSSSGFVFPTDSSSTGDNIEDPGLNDAAVASSFVAVIVSLMAVAIAL